MRFPASIAYGSRSWALLIGWFGLVQATCVYDWPTSRIPNDVQTVGCGNGVTEAPEECDGDDLGAESCLSLGYGGGALACAADCTFDTDGCETNAACGDGVVAPDEACDDGDTTTGDGCDGQCDVEPGWFCDGEPSTCTDGCGNRVCYAADGEDPASCPDDCGWEHLAAGTAHTCGLKRDGSVWCWGANDDGQLGDGTTDSRSEPARVEGLGFVIGLAAGDAHTCAVNTEGHGWCWGANGDGQLGDGTIVPNPMPALVVGLTHAETITAGAHHSCATTTENAALCWGANASGQLGDSTTFGRQVATEVMTGAGMTSVRFIAAGATHTCALGVDDSLWCWGDNASGQLGTGETAGSPLPLPVDPSTGLSAAHVLAAGAYHNCAVDTDGGAWCWGEGSERRLGDGRTTDERSPAAVMDLTGAETITAGGEHSCAVTTEGALWCWGRGTAGQLGLGFTTQRLNPTELDGLNNSVEVAAGGEHSCALTDDALAWCWGSNDAGQLGDASAVSSATPLEVSDPY